MRKFQIFGRILRRGHPNRCTRLTPKSPHKNTVSDNNQDRDLSVQHVGDGWWEYKISDSIFCLEAVFGEEFGEGGGRGLR